MDSAHTGRPPAVSEDCYVVEGRGCALGCAPAPACFEDSGPGGLDHTGLVWEGSPLCAAAPGPPLWALALLLALIRRWGPVLLLALAVEAAAVDVDRLGYSDGRGWVALHDGDAGEPWQVRAALTGAVLRRPLVARYADGAVVPIIGLTSTLAAGASITLDPRIRLGLVVPVHPITVDGAGVWHTLAPGDLAGSVSVPLTSATSRVQAVWRTGFEVPTGDETLLLGGFGSVVAGFAGRVTIAERAAVGAQAAARLRPGEEIGPATVWGSALEYGLGAAVAPVDPVEVGLELFGSLGLRGSDGSVAPLEALLTARVPARGPLALRAAGGGGIGRGLGNPQVRALVGVELAGASARDTDHDGYADLRDLCPRRPEDRDGHRDLEGCPDPDNDRDGILDIADACPDDPETVNAWRDEDGCPDDRAHVVVEVWPDEVEAATVTVGEGPPIPALPGVPATLTVDPGSYSVVVAADGWVPSAVQRTFGEGPTRIRVRLEAVPPGALAVTVLDEGGGPVSAAVEVDGELHPAPAGRVTVHHPPGPVAVAAAAEGFVRRRVDVVAPAEGTLEVEIVLSRPAVALVGRELVVGDTVRFGLDDAAVGPGSEPALDALARWLLDHPEIELLRIEGHADALGSPRYNLDLSRRRAQAVLDALVARGVAPDRLEALGSGESVRLSQDQSERLVEFLVLVWDERSGQTDVPVLP